MDSKGNGTGHERIAELFHAAASDGPPSRFDHRDIVTASRRITARRRGAVVGGAVALMLVAGVGAVAALPRPGDQTLTAAAGAASDAGAQADGAAPQAERATPLDSGGVPAAAPSALPSGPSSVPPLPLPAPVGPVPPPSVVPLGPGTSGCNDPQDPAVRALLAQVLPEAAGAESPAFPAVCVAGTQRSVTLELGGGLLSVTSLPRGTAVSLVPGARSAPTASGGTVVVTVPPAYADRVDTLLAYLAPRL